MPTRTMHRIVSGKLVYASTFDQSNGMVMRMLPEAQDAATLMALMIEKGGGSLPYEHNDYFRKTDVICPASPSPETVDVCITQRCGFGCTFCYQSSTPDRQHAPMELVEAILTAFDPKPYQIAYGGGSPTTHPEFARILQMTREAGIVPNYTTEGAYISDEIAEATNAFCGGVSMTFHSWKGQDWFTKQYKKFDEKILVQKNIHLIFDKDVVANMEYLIKLQGEIDKPLSIILLAYYENVGRGDPALLPSRRTLRTDFPEVCKRAVASGMKVAFSEGLLPYFLSRDILDVSQAVASEGRYACYINEWGAMRKSSFSTMRWHEAYKLLNAVNLPDGYAKDFALKEALNINTGLSVPDFEIFGTIVKNPSREFIAYAKDCIANAGFVAGWKTTGSEPHPEAPEGFRQNPDDVWLVPGLDANRLWQDLRMDATHDSGHEKYGHGIGPDSMDCSRCENEWRCSKADTSMTHMMMCKSAT